MVASGKLKELSKQKEFEKAWRNNEKCKLAPEFFSISLAFPLPLLTFPVPGTQKGLWKPVSCSGWTALLAWGRGARRALKPSPLCSRER